MNGYRLSLGSIALVLLTLLSTATAEVMRLDYEGFTIWLDCDKCGAVKFRYNAQRDQGEFKRHRTFYLDPDVLERCQQTSTVAYKHPDERYDRGHLEPVNHLDNSPTAMKQSNYMVNVLPQAANMNRGAWLRTEEIIECYRDIDELLVIGGVILGDDATDDYFVQSHGVATPSAFWKLIIRGTDRVMGGAEHEGGDLQAARLVSGHGGGVGAANRRGVSRGSGVCQIRETGGLLDHADWL